MTMTRMASLTLALSMFGTLGCAQNLPGGTPAQAPDLPALGTMTSGPVAPDQLLLDDFQTLVDGKALSVDEIRKQLPSRLSEAEAAKMLVKLDLDQVELDSAFETQQWRRGYGGRGYAGRSFFRRGFYGGYGYGSRFFSRSFFGGLGFYPYSGYYFPYYYNAGFYYPYTYSYAGALCSPYLYGYGARFWPYTFAWY